MTDTSVAQLVSAKEAMRLLGIGKTAFYSLAFFKRRKVRVTARAVRYRLSDVLLYQSHHEERAA